MQQREQNFTLYTVSQDTLQGKTWLRRDQQYPWVLVDAFLGVAGLYFLAEDVSFLEGRCLLVSLQQGHQCPWMDPHSVTLYWCDITTWDNIRGMSSFLMNYLEAPWPNCQAPPRGDWWLVLPGCSVLPVLWQAMEAMPACYWSWRPCKSATDPDFQRFAPTHASPASLVYLPSGHLSWFVSITN